MRFAGLVVKANAIGSKLCDPVRIENYGYSYKILIQIAELSLGGGGAAVVAVSDVLVKLKGVEVGRSCRLTSA